MKISKVNNIFHLNRLKGKTSNFENVALQYCSFKTNVVLNILHEIFSYTCCYCFFKTLFKYIICLCCMLLAILKKWKQVSSFFFSKFFCQTLQTTCHESMSMIPLLRYCFALKKTNGLGKKNIVPKHIFWLPFPDIFL